MKGTGALLSLLFDKKLTPEIWKHFAMTNSVKCCAGESMRSVPTELFWNCVSYALSEVQLLAPDVIVTQGANARVWALQAKPEDISCDQASRMIRSAFRDIPDGLYTIVLGILKRELKYIELNGQKAILMHSVHPSAYGNWRRFSEVQLPILSHLIRAWLRENGRSN